MTMPSSLRPPSTRSPVGCLISLGFAAACGLQGLWAQAANPAQPNSSPQPNAQEQPRPVASPVSSQRALLNRYCVTCHNQKLKTANLTLDAVDVDRVAEGAEVWEKVVAKLRAGAMPPASSPRPDKTTLDSFITHLETELD